MLINLFNANRDSLTLHLRITKKFISRFKHCSGFYQVSNFRKKLGGKRKYLTFQHVGVKVLVVDPEYLKRFTAIFENVFDQLSHSVQNNLVRSKAKVNFFMDMLVLNLIIIQLKKQ